MSELYKNSYLLSCVKHGETINLNTMTISRHDSYYTSFLRTVCFEDRVKLRIWTESLVSQLIFAYINNKSLSFPSFPSSAYLRSVSNGLNNIALTYKEDKEFCKSIKYQIESIKCTIIPCCEKTCIHCKNVKILNDNVKNS